MNLKSYLVMFIVVFNIFNFQVNAMITVRKANTSGSSSFKPRPVNQETWEELRKFFNFDKNNKNKVDKYSTASKVAFSGAGATAAVLGGFYVFNSNFRKTCNNYAKRAKEAISKFFNFNPDAVEAKKVSNNDNKFKNLIKTKTGKAAVALTSGACIAGLSYLVYKRLNSNNTKSA